jgi:hypothetical protein
VGLRHATVLVHRTGKGKEAAGKRMAFGPAIATLFVLVFCCPGRLKMIRKLKSGQYRLYSRKVDANTGKRKNLGTFDTRRAAEKHEREVQFFKRRG